MRLAHAVGRAVTSFAAVSVPVVALVLFSALTAAPAAADSSSPRKQKASASSASHLRGAIRDDQGKGIERATVLILEARPREGTSLTCPSCYRDCWRRGETDEHGRFSIDSVDPSLVFRIVALSSEHEPVFLEDVDPKTLPPDVVLKKKAAVPEDPKRVVRGRVVQSDGTSVAHAIIVPKGVKNGTRYGFGKVPALPPPSVADEQGSFTLVAPGPSDALYLLISAPGLSTKAFQDVPTKFDEQNFSVGRGSTIRGRVISRGAPVSGLTVGLIQIDRWSGGFVGELTSTTNSEGRFVITSVLPDDILAIYSKAGDCSTRGALPVKYVETGADRSVIDVGVLATAPCVKLTGSVRFEGEDRAPDEAKVQITRAVAFDQAIAAITSNGTFSISVPRELVDLSLVAPGYRLPTKPYAAPNTVALVLDKDRSLSLNAEREAVPANRR